MPPAAGVAANGNRIPAAVQQPMMAPPSEGFAKDAVIAWFRGEFAAANAIIDALCCHLAQMEDGAAAAAYGSVFEAIHRRRLNWIQILQMQKFYSIADVTLELKKVADKKREERDAKVDTINEAPIGDCAVAIKESSAESDENEGGDVADADFTSDVTDTDLVYAVVHSRRSGIFDNCGSHSATICLEPTEREVQPLNENIDICSNHEDCEARCSQIKMTKGFIAKEPVKGHMVNVVRGLKLYEGIFNVVELSKLVDFANELRVAGQNGELSGETFILYNQQTKGNKRELVQLGVPIFGKIKDDETIQEGYIEPIPALLRGVIQHLIQWRLIPENREPNSCIINFFDEGEYSQPFLKPPHLEQPLSTLLLSESTMAFGRMLTNDGEGNYRGPLMLSLKEGSLLVMRGNSSDTARHVMCASPNKRVSITFFKVRIETVSNHPSEVTPLPKAITLWQPSVPTPYTIQNGYEAMSMMPKWGLLRGPVVMLAPVPPLVVNPRRIPRGGTGVFLPWTMGSRRHAKHLPPRAQRGRFLALPSPDDTNKPGSASVNVDSP